MTDEQKVIVILDNVLSLQMMFDMICSCFKKQVLFLILSVGGLEDSDLSL